MGNARKALGARGAWGSLMRARSPWCADPPQKMAGMWRRSQLGGWSHKLSLLSTGTGSGAALWCLGEGLA
jgi:hypothetical protein